MKRILGLTLALLMVLAAFNGCMASQNHWKNEETQNPPKADSGTETSKPPALEEIIDLQINSIDKLNYYAAVRVLTETPAPENQSMADGSYGVSLLTADLGTDKTEEPPAPETDGSEEAQDSNSSGFADSKENIYYYKLDPDQPFAVNKVSLFQIELTDENGFLSSKLGSGIVDVVIAENCIWDDSLITFRRGEKFFSCLSNGWSLNQATGECLWDFSTHKYVEGFCIVKNFEQENYAFYVDMNTEGQATAFECREAQNGGYRADQNVKVVSSTAVSAEGSSFTIAELEAYFNNGSVL